MDMTIDQQVALDEALVPHASRLRIGRSNFRLQSDISSKESTLQLVYDVLRQNPFFKAFLVTADVPKIYMQEFWVTSTIHHHSIRGDSGFLQFLGHNGEIRRLTDVNNNKLHQPWRSFASIINKCLSGKSSGYDSLRLSQAQILWGLCHKRNTKASVRKTKSSFDTTITPPPTTAAGTRLSTSAKGKQPAKASKAKSADEGTGTILGVPDVPTKESDEEISWKSSDEGDDDDVDKGSDDEDDDDAQDDDDQDEGNNDDDQEEGSDDEQASDEEGEEFIHPSLSSHDKKETRDEENFDPIAKTPKNKDDEEGDEDELYKDMDVQPPTIVAPLPLSAPTLTPSTISAISTITQAPTPPTTGPSTLLQNLPNFGSLFGFDHRLKTLEDNFYEFIQTNLFVGASDRLRDEAQAENEEFLKNFDENIQKIIKEQVKEQVKVQVTKILLKIKQTVNEQLEAKVLTRSSNSSKTSYVVALDLSEIELKKILIDKMEGNKSIHRSNEQRNLYKALVEAYKSDKIILDTYRDTVTLKRRRDDDADKDEEPFAGSDRGSKRRREGKEPELASAPKEKATRSTGKSTQGSKSRPTSASESATAEEPMQTTHEMEEPSHPEFETGADDQPIADPSQHPEWFSQQMKPPTPDRD
nr:hypothetical protein [Tanacetum cinerariifolium]